MKRAIATLALFLGGGVFAQESGSFKMKRLTISMVGQRSESLSFKNTVTASETAGSSGVCPSGTTSTTGFFSLRGTGAVPILLRATHNAIEPQDIDLTWTGQATQFTLYRSTSPENIVAPENLFSSTLVCGETDRGAIGFDFLFYKVIASQP